MPPVSDLERLSRRVDALADDVVDIRLSLAAREEGMKSTHARLDKIETLLSRINWLILSGIGMAVIAFIVGGGLSRVTL